MFYWDNLPAFFCPIAPYYPSKVYAKLSTTTQRKQNFGGMIMGNFTEIMALISIMFTAVMLLVENVIEDRQEKKEAELRKAKEKHEEIKRRWKEAEEA